MDPSTIYVLVAISIIPMLLGIFAGYFGFSRKRLNPVTGAIIGSLVGLLTSYLGLIIFILVTATKRKYKKYALYRGGPQRLDVSWSYGFRNVAVKLDEKIIGDIKTQGEAKQGVTYKLPDGSDLFITVGHDFFGPVPVLTLNGKPIPNSVNDPQMVLVAASNYFWLGAILSFLQGIFYTIYFSVDTWGTAALFFGEAIVVFIIGFFIRRRSKVALYCGVVYGLIGGIALLILFVSGGGPEQFINNINDLIAEIAILTGLFKGFGAIKQLEKET